MLRYGALEGLQNRTHPASKVAAGTILMKIVYNRIVSAQLIAWLPALN